MHRAPPSLQCHHCGHIEPLPRACPSCGNVDLVPLGLGTQRLERALAAMFPQARIARVDRDSTRARHAFASVRDKVEANAIDILVGTQMLAKGHDFPRLTLVGIVGGDNALYSADFRATERLAALLVQVAGRAGRAEAPGEVVVQTDFPEHPVYAALLSHDYAQLADALLVEREAAGLPPYTHAALLSAEAHRREDVDAFLRAAHAIGVDARRYRMPKWTCSRRSQHCSRGARASSAASSSCRACAGARCSASCPPGTSGSPRFRDGARAGRSTSTRPASADPPGIILGLPDSRSK